MMVPLGALFKPFAAASSPFLRNTSTDMQYDGFKTVGQTNECRKCV